MGALPVPTGIRRGVAFGMFADAAATVSGLLITVIVARWLGPSSRGVYFLAVMVATLIAMLGELGLSSASVAYARSQDFSPRGLHGLGVFAAGVAAIVGTTALLVFEPLLGGVLRGVRLHELALAGAAILPLVYGQIAGALLTGLGQISALSSVRVMSALLGPLVMFVACWVGDGRATWAIAAWLIASACSGAMLFTILARRGISPNAPPRSEVRDVVHFGVRGQLGSLSHFGFLRIDVLFISSQLGPRAVGLYSLAAVLAEKLTVVGSALYGASASHVASRGPRVAAELVARIVRTAAVGLVLVAIPLGLGAGPLIRTIFGSDYQGAVRPFILLLPGTICLTVWYLLSLFLVVAARRPGLTTILQAGALAVSIPLYAVSVSSWGMTGGAVVSSAVYGVLMSAGAIAFVHLTQAEWRSLVPRLSDVTTAVAASRRVIRPGAPDA